LLGLNGVIIFNLGHTLMELAQLRRQIPPIGWIKTSCLVIGQLFLPMLEGHLLHGQNKPTSAQDPVKL
jgi:hypothetical protein